VLVVAEWDCATRSMMDGVRIIERIHARGAMIKVLDKPHLDLTTPIGRGFITFLSALAEDERLSLGATIKVTTSSGAVRAAHDAAPNVPIVTWAGPSPVLMGWRRPWQGAAA
jgi:hypothetical protein